MLLKKIKNQFCKILVLPDRLSEWQAAGLLFILALLLRVAFILIFRGGFTTFPQEPDGSYYYHTGLNLLDHGVLGLEASTPLLGQPPGQSFFLALALGMSGRSLAFSLFAQSLLSAATVVVAYFTGKRVFTPIVGFWAGFLLAIDPAQIYLSSTLLSEPLFIFLMCTGIYLLVIVQTTADKLPAPHRFPVWVPILAGVCFAGAGLTRNQGWPFVLLVLGFAHCMARALDSHPDRYPGPGYHPAASDSMVCAQFPDIWGMDPSFLQWWIDIMVGKQS